MLIEDVSAAKNNNRKNTDPNIIPPVIPPNAIGSAIKANPVPSDGSILNAKIIGNIIKPASNAMIVSALAIMRTFEEAMFAC